MGGGPERKPRPEHLLIALPFPKQSSVISSLKKSHPTLTVTWHQSTRDEASPPDLFANCTILATFSDLPKKPAEDAPQLRWVHLLSAGIDHVVKQPIYTDSDVILSSSNGVAAPQIAEWVVMTMLTSAHLYDRFHDQQKEHVWDKSNVSINDLPGQRVGILGYGSIGRHVGRLSKALGMEVYAYTATEKKTPESKKDDGYIVPGTGDPDGDVPTKWFSGLDKGNLHEFLGQNLDAVVLTLPLTDQTRHMLSTSEFKILGKKKAFLANISRGPIVDTPALISAVKSEQLRGVALDVTDPEPLPPDNELWDLPNVTVHPHVSGSGNAYLGRAFALLSQSLERWANGDKILNQVDRKRGY